MTIRSATARRRVALPIRINLRNTRRIPTPAAALTRRSSTVVPIGASLWAILAGYAGLLSLGFCCLGPPAIVFGILGIRDIRRNPQRHGMVRCVLGIVFGTIGTIGLIIMVIVFASKAVE